jgi:hypothetical protein
MMNIPGVEFPSAWERNVESIYGEEPIKFIGIDDLMQAKRTMDRSKTGLMLRVLSGQEI